jgi:hypothetical protein
MFRKPVIPLVLALVLVLAGLVPGCAEEPVVPVLSAPIPPPADRPADPGLSHAFTCLTDDPVEYPVRFGSRPLSGIPALIDPPFVKAEDATYLFPDDWVFGVEIAGRFFAFPARILNYHEIVTFSVDSYRYAASW